MPTSTSVARSFWNEPSRGFKAEHGVQRPALFQGGEQLTAGPPDKRRATSTATANIAVCQQRPHARSPIASQWLEQGIPADRILLLTFTNKAAGEMMRRVASLLGRQLPSLWGGTFHSIGARVLRLHAELLGHRRDFTILDRNDAKDLIKTCIAAAGIETKGTHFPKPEVLCEIFSLAVNTHKTTDEILEEQYDYFAQFSAQIADVQKRYTARKRASNAMDFDDLLALWLKLLQDHADMRDHYQRRFQFILVDEYQDTNKLQSDLIDLLAGRHHNVTVVGDDAQSIYAWRGANFENIFKFPKRYPDAKVFKIETNYRSTPEILKVANAAIATNRNQFTKILAPSRKSGMKPALIACMDSAQQAAFISQRVIELREEGTSMNQIAVLYRSHFHALELQLELTKRQIPFSITSGIRFFEQAHIKDATAHSSWSPTRTTKLLSNGSCNCCPASPRKARKKSGRFSKVGVEVMRLKPHLQIKSQSLLTSAPTKLR